MQPLVTIGLPFYNNSSTLELSIKSVLAQTYGNWQLILVNDGSSDDSESIAKKYTHLQNVKLISDGTNKGLIARLNQLVQIAEGEYLARMDADDLMDPTRIEKQMNYLLQHPEVDLVDTGTYSINEHGKPMGKRGLEDINNYPSNVLKNALLLHASVTGKRSWFLQNSYNENYLRAEDYELWCRTFRHSTFGRIKEPLYIVREGNVNLKNYICSSKTISKIVKNYSKGILKPVEKYKLYFTLSLKRNAYRIFSIFNKHHILSSSRNAGLTNEERRHVEELIFNISRIKIPA